MISMALVPACMPEYAGKEVFLIVPTKKSPVGYGSSKDLSILKPVFQATEKKKIK